MAIDTAQSMYASEGSVPAYNPTNVSNSTKSYGKDTEQFMVEPFIQPFNYGQQKQENQNLVSGFQNAINSQETMPALQQRYENRYMIPQLREMQQTGTEAYQNVVNQIRDIPKNVAANTRNSLVTQGQASNMSQAQYQKLAPIAQSLGQTVERVGQMLTSAEQNLNTGLQMEIAQQKKELMPWEWGYNLQTIMQAREMTGWSQAQQMELNRLLANQQAGLTWTNAQAQRAHDLQVIEKQYQNQLSLLDKQSELALDLWG